MGKMENAQWFAVETSYNKSDVVKQRLEKFVKHKGMDNMILRIATGKAREYRNYIFVKMINTIEARNAILNFMDVKRFLGPKQNPTPITEAEMAFLT